MAPEADEYMDWYVHKDKCWLKQHFLTSQYHHCCNATLAHKISPCPHGYLLTKPANPKGDIKLAG